MLDFELFELLTKLGFKLHRPESLCRGSFVFKLPGKDLWAIVYRAQDFYGLEVKGADALTILHSSKALVAELSYWAKK